MFSSISYYLSFHGKNHSTILVMILCSDFAEKIDSADGDETRILNLLRGFFFWLRVSCFCSLHFLDLPSLCVDIKIDVFFVFYDRILQMWDRLDHGWIRHA